VRADRVRFRLQPEIIGANMAHLLPDGRRPRQPIDPWRENFRTVPDRTRPNQRPGSTTWFAGPTTGARLSPTQSPSKAGRSCRRGRGGDWLQRAFRPPCRDRGCATDLRLRHGH
jgi:hypothetical protein